LHLAVNSEIWESLTTSDKAVIETACTAGVTKNLSRSEGLQGSIISKFSDVGVSPELLPDEILRELKTITNQIMDSEAKADPDFRVIYESQRAFREEYATWKSYAYLPRGF